MEFIDAWTEAVRVTAERNVEIFQEAVAASEEALWLVGASVYGGLPIEDHDTVCEVCSHNEIVLDYESCLLGMHNEALDHARRNDTLL